MQEWLSEEEQYKMHINKNEISRIQDPNLREIRMRHWEYRLKIFLDGQNISDSELMRLTDEDWEKERIEIEKYKQGF